MNEFDQIEEQLRQLKPAPPSDDLLGRLMATRPAQVPEECVRSWDWRDVLLRVVTPLAATAAIVVAFMIYFANRNPAPTEPKVAGGSPAPVVTTYRPVQVEDHVIKAREVGIYTGPNDRPYRIVHCLGVNRQIWENAATGSRIERTSPEQRVLLVGMETY